MPATRILALLALLALASVAGRAQAQATATTTFEVRIQISSVCTINNPAATAMDFGPHPSSGAQVDATSVLSINCTPGTAYNVGLDAGQNAGGGGINARAMTSGSALVPYQLYRDPGRTAIWGTTIGTDTYAGSGIGAVQSVTVYGRVPNTNAPAGSYLDTITATITY